MQFAIDMYESIRDFLELGGGVLVVIAWTIFFMWVLILERFVFFRTTMNRLAKEAVDAWEARAERRSWEAHRIRDALVSKVKVSANAGLPLIKSLVALCPLLGLLGTVTGMIEVFDVMAVTGTGNARAMASGVSKATVPTMAGMVGALSGVLFASILTSWANRRVHLVEDSLVMDH
jgi:biopolymer transport protein ExbB